MKKYSYKEEIGQQACILEEPEAAYASSVSMDKGAFLSDEILEKAALCAIRDRENGRMIPHDQVFEILKGRFGWK